MTFETALASVKANMRANRVVMVDPEKLATQIADEVCRRMRNTKILLGTDEGPMSLIALDVIHKYIDDQHEQLLKD